MDVSKEVAATKKDVLTALALLGGKPCSACISLVLTALALF
jgi:hypothetical protein